jgi:hypothetical protein
MANKEPDKNVETVHLLIAVRRNKENKGVPGELCFRFIDRGQETKDMLLARIQHYPGTWRIYRTVNARNTARALKVLMKILIDEPERQAGKIESLWKTCLLQRECRAEKNILIDIDAKEIIDEIKDLVSRDDLLKCVFTSNGAHIVCKNFDSRLIEKYGKDYVGINRDGYIFIDRIEVKL